MEKIELLPELQRYVEQFQDREVSSDRNQVLEPLIAYVREKHSTNKAVNLNFICTHNSRRSQLSQIWAKVASEHFGIDLNCYSGGVEVTAFNERAVESIKRAGFRVTQKGEGNPHHFVFYADDADPIVAFSKRYDDTANIRQDFAAVMTCSHADENCPFIPGAEARIPVMYEDPKAFDGTNREAEKYDERSMQIATEMFYVFSKIK
ncbi:arsenate reductase/protein-tyrosine-phosphatase family protein [Echinicola rosea]|uniref:Arsenate reductase n=1 Tax=Echinicola rosea TaxID=1807691 RepID=A0ABQ1V3S2_9BACT|nr:protein-tyrosine-phosphatase [Echinicola rosea]GGF36899.1 arsenate reductase [Echinicola rosea]